MPKSTNKRSRAWIFVLNNPTVEDKTFFAGKPFRTTASHFVAQLEVGVGGTPHLQGYVRWTNAKAFGPTKTLLRNAHVEAARGSLTDNYKYATKPTGRLDGPWHFGFAPQRVLPTTLWPWQHACKQMLSRPADDRTIYWFWEPVGNVGKSRLTWVLSEDFDALLVGHNARDAKCAVKLAWYVDGSPPEHPIIMFDLPRESQTPLLFHVIEKMKDGMFFSGKYKSSMVKLPYVQVAVFSNEPPLHSTLSVDKLRVYRIDHALRLSVHNPIAEGLPYYGPAY